MTSPGEVYERQLRAYQTARDKAVSAMSLASSAAVEIADQILECGGVDELALAVYKKAKDAAERERLAQLEAWESCDKAYRAWTGREEKMPPAGATAEGDETKPKR